MAIQALHILRPAAYGYVEPLQTDFTERHECGACGWVRDRVRPEPPPYRIRLTKRGKQPGMFLNNQPTRATLIHDRVVRSLQDAGLDSGLSLIPAEVEPYSSRYWVAWSPTLLCAAPGGTSPGDVRVECASCGGLALHAGAPSGVTFKRPSVVADWYDTTLQREPSLWFAVSARVREFLESAPMVRLLAASKLFPAPAWEAATVE